MQTLSLRGSVLEEVVQTFVPFKCYVKSAKALDRARLGKQRVECIQILNCLSPEYDKEGWKNHPAVKMWKGHEGALARYGLACVEEWVSRGYRDFKCRPQLQAYADSYKDETQPEWFGDDRVHLSHKSNLLRKDPKHYGPLFPDVPNDLPYFWPTAEKATKKEEENA